MSSSPNKITVSFFVYAKHHFLWLVLILALLYPGQNANFTLVINPQSAFALPSPNTLSPYPLNDGTPFPAITAKAVIVQDAVGRSILYERNADTPMLPASTTKLMTALVALDIYQDLNTPLRVSVEDKTLGQTMNLQKNETISVYNLLAGLLIRSANDAALTLANNAPGGYSEFVSMMNKKAKKLGLTNTNYKNPSGLEQYDHVTTARDLAVLISEVVKHDLLTTLMLTQHLTVTDTTGTITHYLKTTDDLLGNVAGIKAAKTGFTHNAGECLVTYVEKEEKSIITVVLNSQDRFGETRKIIDWAFSHHHWLIPPEI